MNRYLTILLAVGIIIACCTLSPTHAYNLLGTVTDILGSAISQPEVNLSIMNKGLRSS